MIALLLRTGVVSRIEEAVEVLYRPHSLVCVDKDGTPLARLEESDVFGYSFFEEGLQSLRDQLASRADPPPTIALQN